VAVGNVVSVARIGCGAGFDPLVLKGAVGLAKEGQRSSETNKKKPLNIKNIFQKIDFKYTTAIRYQ